MIPNEEINQIKKSANIIDIISSYVPLEKKGKNYFGICPFHDDHSPSMSVSEDMQIFTCFTCHETGNVFNFVEKYENIPFVDAVKKVADMVGISISDEYKSTSIYDKHYEAVDLAVKFYQNNLKTVDGKIAREYLSNRGISNEVIDEFQIGLAPKNADTVTKLLLGKGYDENVLLDAGLSNRTTTLHDLFRNRITFPIHNIQGKPVGFSARIYEKSDDPKYINTRETKIFKKGEVLFNYHRAQNEARKLKSLIIVEGQMDAIRVYSSGIKNVVATMGTALTKDHIKLLKKLNVPIILCMDNDSAGEQATITNGENLYAAGIEVKVLRLSGEKDPDEYILKNGVEAYQEAINHSVNYFDFKLTYLGKNKNLNKAEDASKYINAVINELNKTNDQVLIDLTINELVDRFKVDKNTLLNKVIKVDNKEISKPASVKPKQRLSKNLKLCDTLIYYMMCEDKYIKLYQQELSYIPEETYAKIAEDILAFYLEYNYINIADFITFEIESENYSKVLSIIDNNANIELIDADYVGIIKKIKQWSYEIKIQELKEKLNSISDINEKVQILETMTDLKKRMCE